MIYSDKKVIVAITVSVFLVTFLLFSVKLFSGEKGGLSIAKKLMEDGLYQIAYDEFIRFAENNRDSEDVPEAYYLAYDCLFLQEKYAEAVIGFRKFIREIPFSTFTPFAQERLGEVYLKLGQYNKAKDTFEKFIKIYPENERAEDAIFWLGETYYKREEYKKARYYYNLVTERYPNGRFYDYAFFSLGYVARDQNKFEEAEQFFTYLIENLPKSSLVEDAYIAMGEMRYETGDSDGALEVFNDYRNRFKTGKYYDKSLLFTGRIYRKDGKTDKALQVFENLIEKFPHSEYRNPAVYFIAWLYFERKNYSKAFQYFGMVEEKSKLYYPSFYWMGITLERQGKKDEAVEQFERLSSIEGAGSYGKDAIYELARIGYESEQEAKADSFVRKLQETKKKWKALLLKANYLYSKRQYKDAIEIYLEIVKGPSKDNAVREAVYRLASTLYEEKDYQKAEDYISIYLDGYPDGKYRKEAMLLFAECAYNLEKWDEALKRYRDVKNNFPDSREAKLALMGEGWTLSKLGRDREAYNILKKVKGVEGEEKDYLTLGDAAYNAGRFSEAISNYKKASKEEKNRELALIKLGNTYFRMDRMSDAINTYDDLIEQFPMGNFADDAYIKKGEALRKLGDYEKSSDVLNSLRKLYPSSEFIVRSYVLSGDNYFDTGDFENARIEYQNILERLTLPGDSAVIVPINGIMKCLQRKDGIERASEFADTYIDRFKGTYLSERVKMLKADMLYYSGNVEDAESEYGKIENRKLKPSALYYQARCLKALGKNNEAEKRLRKVIDEFPGSDLVSRASILLGKILFEKKRFSECLEFLEKREELETDEDFEIAYIKSQAYLKLNYETKAKDVLEKIVESTEGKWKGKALLAIGNIMFNAEKFSEAISYYDKALKTGENIVLAEAYYRKGEALRMQGKNKEALTTFLKVKYNLPDSQFTTKAIFAAGEIALDTGKKSDALSLFKEVIERNDDKTLSIRAKERIKTINP
jgi:TolA-binding protein